jgi:hypothetical protein
MSLDKSSLSEWQTSVLARLAACDGDQAKLTLVALDISLGDAATRLRPLIEAASLTHWFTRETLSALLGENAVSQADYAALTAIPQVEPMGKAWSVHESTRLALRNHMVNADPVRFRCLSTRAKAFFERAGSIGLEEACFHGLALGWQNAQRMTRFLASEPGSANRSCWLHYFSEFMHSAAPKRLYPDFGFLMLWKQFRRCNRLFVDHGKLLMATSK